MVAERLITKYACEYCQREYVTLNQAEDCEKRCMRLAESPGIEISMLINSTSILH